MATANPPAPAKKPEWAPRMWEGCNLYAWLRLLVKNRFAVNWRYWYIAVIVTFVSTFHTIMAAIQWLFYGLAVRRTQITQPPIFILGHWRTGTTLLHELMIQDARHGYPTTYECLDPNHFLLTERFFTRWMPFLMPKQRPMDNMKAGFDRPQEDEFALCMLGVPSPYLTVAFPNRPPQDQAYLDLEGLPERKVRAWQRSLMNFLRCITYKTGKRLVLKSPTHTARIKILKEMFPDAVFIHIVRDPCVVFPSTMNLWRTLYRTHGLQKPTYDGLEEQVLSTFTRMYARFDEQKTLVDPGRFYELRYEDLVKEPVEEIRKIYEHLKLDGFEAMRPNLEAYLAGVKGYETNKYQLSPEQRTLVEDRWGATMRRYGYGAAETAGKREATTLSPG